MRIGNYEVKIIWMPQLIKAGAAGVLGGSIVSLIIIIIIGFLLK